MKQLLDFLPVVAFFIAYFLFGRDMYLAVIVLMVATAIQFALLLILKHEISTMHKVSAGLVMVLGAVTLFLRNDMFIKWKPTVLYWIFAAVLMGSEYFHKTSVMERLMGSAITLEKPIWRSVTHIWTVAFIAFGAINLFVVYNFSEAAWVNFKLFGLMGLTFLLMIITVLRIHKHLPAEEET